VPNISPVFSKFAEAVNSLKQQAVRLELSGSLPSYAKFIKTAQGLIQSGQRFYVPQSRNVIEGREYSKEVKNTIRLPFETTVLLTETFLREPDEPTWQITIAVDEKISSKHNLINLNNVHSDDYKYFLIAAVRDPSDGTWGILPAIGVCFIPFDEVGIKFNAGIVTEMKEHPLIEQLNPLVELESNYCDINNLCILLGLHNVNKQEQLPPLALNKKRVISNKIPFSSYHVLTVDGETWDKSSSRSESEDHYFRSHFRRGHIRRLDESRRVWVRSCFVHGNLPGFVEKDYQVQAAAAR
jgi:hypothetical protein